MQSSCVRRDMATMVTARSVLVGTIGEILNLVL
jgi:hypothetical protein